jgi:hypothetical protein
MRLKLTLVLAALTVTFNANAQFGSILKNINNEIGKANPGAQSRQSPDAANSVTPNPPASTNADNSRRQVPQSATASMANIENLANNYCAKLNSSEFAKKISELMHYAKVNKDDQLSYPEISFGMLGGGKKDKQAIENWVKENLSREIGVKVGYGLPAGQTGTYEKLTAAVNKCFTEKYDEKIYLISQQRDFDTVKGNTNLRTVKGGDVIPRTRPTSPNDFHWSPQDAREYFLYAFFFEGADNFFAKLDPNPLQQFEGLVQKEVAMYKDSRPVPLADFKNKWCQNIDRSHMSPVEYREIRAGDGCLLPDEVMAGVLKKLKEVKVDIMNLQVPISSQLENIDAGELKFPLIKFVFNPKESKFYVGLFDAMICPTSETNSLTEANSFRTALESKYGKPSGVITEYAKFKVQVDAAESMIAEQKKKIITVADAKAVRDGEQQVNILKNMLNGMDQKTPAQLNWEYDPKNRVQGETGLIVAKVKNTDISSSMRCKGNIPTAFMIQIIGTSSLQTVFKRIANEIRQNDANKEKSAPTPKL